MDNLHDLIVDMTDMHVHCVPDVSPAHRQTRDNHQMIEECIAKGMHGIVLKNHGYPNIGLAKELDKQYENFTVYSSITLNSIAGGPKGWVAELAAALDVDMMWLPTFTAQNEVDHGGFIDLANTDIPGVKDLMLKDESAFISICNEDGSLKQDVKDVVDVCKAHDICLATGHISSDESLAVAKYAHEVGFTKLVLTHPLNGLCLSTAERIKEIAELGAYIELLSGFVGPMFNCATIPQLVDLIKSVGAEHIIAGTDHFFDWEPSIPESLYQFFGCLYDSGVSYDELYQMSHNWKKLLKR